MGIAETTTDPTTATATGEPVSDAVRIARLGTAYRQARVLHAAVEVGLFEALADAPAGAAEIGDRLGLHPRLLGTVLDTLVGLGLLDRSVAGYAPSAAARRHLLPGGDVDLRGLVRTAGRTHYGIWAALPEALRDGRPKGPRRPDGPFSPSYEDPERARAFLTHMDSINSLIAPHLAGVLDWHRYTTVTDVGGARGNVAATLVRAFPHLTAAVVDLPAVEPLFDEHMAALGTADQVRFVAADFFADPLPATDVVVFGHVLHDWPEAERRTLLAKAYEALPAGGAVVVYDQMLDEDAPSLPSLLGSLNVALLTDGSEYPVEDCRRWLADVGFRVVGGRRVPSIGEDYVLVGERT